MSNIPLFEKDGFIICFEAEPEEIDMRHHFVKELGWTEAQYRKIKDYSWFCAKVSAWKDSEEIASDYLGVCCYESESDFYTKYRDEYFKDMVKEVLTEAKKVKRGSK